MRFEFDLVFRVCLIGRDAKEMKRRRELEFEGRGPKSKAKRRSLELVSQVMNKAVTPVGRTVVN